MGVLALALAACTSDPEPAVTSSGATTQSAIPAPDVSISASPLIPNVATAADIATATSGEVTVYDSPDGEEQELIAAEDVLTVPDATPLTFLVKRSQGEWLEVYLPVRPNGSTGWIQAADVSVSSTDFRVEIGLEDFTLTVYQGSDAVLSTPIGVGTSDRPTPGGVYYIRELLQPDTDDGPYGPYAYGLSGYSPVLDSFNGGEAIIGMHGTNEPDSIGEYVSSGCIRMSNDAVTELVTEVGLPLGTPVYISEDAAPVEDV
ncbi:L,D-transpeptidase [Demequina sp. B12]|uniref:L,D-transpeptidase n=1 Tax=Demequina sp. B12 TaxID=2992757 RepID=UPI00237AC43C|nr:L,D-transpeptidase [Demequina sp. B12]MDE0573635.1 L,D-transpeptidase [Demequina sp. B12]